MIEELIKKYRYSAEKHGKATLEGNHKSANKCYDTLIKTLKLILAYEDEGKMALLSLLEDSESDSVRCWAASHLLFVDESRALDVLKDLAKSERFIAFGAEVVIQEWENGNLKQP